MSSTSPNPSDAAEIEAIARDYGEGWYTGDAARMERALHSELVKTPGGCKIANVLLHTRD